MDHFIARPRRRCRERMDHFVPRLRGKKRYASGRARKLGAARRFVYLAMPLCTASRGRPPRKLMPPGKLGTPATVKQCGVLLRKPWSKRYLSSVTPHRPMALGDWPLLTALSKKSLVSWPSFSHCLRSPSVFAGEELRMRACSTLRAGSKLVCSPAENCGMVNSISSRACCSFRASSICCWMAACCSADISGAPLSASSAVGMAWGAFFCACAAAIWSWDIPIRVIHFSSSCIASSSSSLQSLWASLMEIG
mmetsp:Transcript_20773/g.64892  ORF Transcript_20773/g.64892 Transcript_20773/m.64892 type:complete len:251 (-) Transcript_20773:1631-2383(-)